MDFNNRSMQQQNSEAASTSWDGTIGSKELSKSFLANVFSYMSAALALSGFTAWWFGTTPSLLRYLFNLQTGGMTGLGYIVMFAPFVLVLVMGFRYRKMNSMSLMGVFFLYSILMGMSLSFIFVAYTQASIASTFFISAGTFGAMAVLGYTTSTDLTKFGSILMMALIGLIIAMVVNMFLHSDSMYYIISFIGVILFTGLTAYDVQKLKKIGYMTDHSSEVGTKLALIGALNLYLDFVNLFLFLLNLFGRRN